MQFFQAYLTIYFTIGITLRNLFKNRKYFNQLASGPSGFDWWKKTRDWKSHWIVTLTLAPPWAGVLGPPYFWKVTQTCMFWNKTFTDQGEFNQHMCRWFLKDKIKMLKSFCSNLIKIRAFFVSPEHRCLHHLTGFTQLRTWALDLVTRILIHYFRCGRCIRNPAPDRPCLTTAQHPWA